MSSSHCEIVYSNKRSEDGHVIKAKLSFSAFSYLILNENEATLLFSCLLIAASLFIMFLWKKGDDIWPKFAECLTNLQLLQTSKCGKKFIIRSSSSLRAGS